MITVNPQIIGIINQANFLNFVVHTDSDSTVELSLCSLIEFRADTFMPLEIPAKLAQLQFFIKTQKNWNPRIIFTLRMNRDGGEWKESSISRLPIWDECLKNDLLDLIDIEIEEISFLGSFVKNIAKNKKASILLSHHNFESSYSALEFQERLKEMTTYNPSAVKFAITLQSKIDFLELMTFSRDLVLTYPLSCCISMGKWGKSSRLASPLVGAPMTYGFLGKKAVVSGQFSVNSLDKNIRMLEQDVLDKPSDEEIIERLQNKKYE